MSAAIRKITAEPAKKFNLDKRGLVKEGSIADLAMFSIDEKASSYGKYVDFKATVVNGRVVMQDGLFKGNFSGKPLKHKPQ